MPCKTVWRTRVRGTPKQVGKKFLLRAKMSSKNLPRNVSIHPSNRISKEKAYQIAKRIASSYRGAGEPVIKEQADTYVVVVPLKSSIDEKSIIGFIVGNIDKRTGNYGGTSISASHIELAKKLQRESAKKGA